MQAFLIKASSFGLCEMASVFKARMNRQSNRPGNLKGVAGFKNQAELKPMKCWSQSRTSCTTLILIVFPTQMLQYLRFVWDCGVCSLSCAECPLNSEKARAMIGCFNTRYFAFNFNRHLPHVQVVTRDCGLR